MTHYHSQEPARTVTERTYTVYGWTINESALRRLIGLIQLAFVILNGMIALRFVLKLMAANPASPFAQLVYFFTAPFLWPFQGITYTPAFGGMEIEFFSLIAIAVYFLLAWIITRLIWLLFARMR
jgi:uncharacterized protein YggT (Ycf19 family)